MPAPEPCPRLGELATAATTAAATGPAVILCTAPHPYPTPADELRQHGWRLPLEVRVDAFATVARTAVRLEGGIHGSRDAGSVHAGERLTAASRCPEW